MLGGIATAPVASAGGPGRGAAYVALGDSYAAGEGLGNYENGTSVDPVGNPNANPRKNTCHRSLAGAYGSLNQASPVVLPSLPMAQRSFWACSGATTADISRSQGTLAVGDPQYQASQPAQDRAVAPGTRWVSISVGGNDVKFSEIGKACSVATNGATAGYLSASIPGLTSQTCAQTLAFAATKLASLPDTLSGIYKQLLDNAPGSVLAVVGYPRVFPADLSRSLVTSRDKKKVCLTNVYYRDATNGVIDGVGFYADQAQLIEQNVITGLNNAAKAAIQRVLQRGSAYSGRIGFADTDATSVPQSCTGQTSGVTVNGVVLSPGLNGLSGNLGSRLVSTATFHPTADGQRVLGRAVDDVFTRLQLTYSGAGLTLTGTVGDPASASTSVTNGVLPLSVVPSIDGTIPPWLGITVQDRSITASGTPTSNGRWASRLQVTDAHGDSVSIPLTVVATDALVVPAATLPAATVGQPYTAALAATGGSAPYVWTASGLPAGVAVASGGTLTGRPTAAGTTTFIATATDAQGRTASGSVTVTVSPGPGTELFVYRPAGPAGFITWARGLSCPAPGAGKTMWVVTQGAGQPGPDVDGATVFGQVTDRGVPGAYIPTTADAPLGDFTATISCVEGSSLTAQGGAVVKTYTVAQNVTGPQIHLQITPGTDGLPGPRFTISGNPGCGPGLQQANIQIYDHDGISTAYLFTGVPSDGNGTWPPVTLTFPNGPAHAWDVAVTCYGSTGGDRSSYPYPVATVPVPD